jgi:hypothetical protein
MTPLERETEANLRQPTPAAESKRRTGRERRGSAQVDNSKGKNRQPVVKNMVCCDSFRCMYTNIDSLINKKDELVCRVHEPNPDIIGVTKMLP